MRACHKACLFRHAGNAFVGLFDHVLRRFDAYAVDVFDQAQVDGLFEQTAEVIRADVKLVGNACQGQLLGVMLRNIAFGSD